MKQNQILETKMMEGLDFPENYEDIIKGVILSYSEEEKIPEPPHWKDWNKEKQTFVVMSPADPDY